MVKTMLIGKYLFRLFFYNTYRGFNGGTIFLLIYLVIIFLINRTIRAPVPWHEDYAQSHDWIFINLHLVNRVNSALQDFWHYK